MRANASCRLALPLRIDLTSVPFNSMPASNTCNISYSWRARRLSAITLLVRGFFSVFGWALACGMRFGSGGTAHIQGFPASCGIRYNDSASEETLVIKIGPLVATDYGQACALLGLQEE